MLKRGTVIGEMSQLATLCSLHAHYINVIQGLAALYCKCSYPQDLVYYWINENTSKRWENHLRQRPDDLSAPHNNVLVLKFTYNTIWDYFSAKELGDTVLEYWHDYLSHVKVNHFTVCFPKFSHELGDLDDFNLVLRGHLWFSSIV